MSDVLAQAFEAAVRSVFGHRIDFLAAYPSRAVKQNSNGTLELVPDDARLPTYKNVPIRYGVPGVSATITAGARVLLEFAAGDPQKPIATVWESASVTELKFNGGTAGVARTGDAVGATTAMATWMSQVAGFINGVTPGTVAPTPPSSFGTISGGSTVVKAG